ncbi:MAG: hypothetical protein ACI4M8_06820, partial [Christensenellales bacterium]
TMENGDYSVWYTSDKTNWNSDIAPTNCDYYEVTVKITNKNYSESPQTGYIEIMRAQVEIDFGGEGVQIYGNVTEGLTAVANGVHGYSTPLAVNYYYITDEGTQGERVPDISVAPAGTYIAEAIHYATDNFADKRAVEIFTIARRNAAINYDVAPKYKYNGVPVSIKMYFVDNGETYYPMLIFDKSVNGEWIPYNYSIDGDVISDIGENPSDVGVYRVKAYEYLQNYYVTAPVWCVFNIEKADLIIQVTDITVNEKTDYTVGATMNGCLTDDPMSAVVNGIKFRYYAMNGEELASQPKTPGTYRVVGYGATSQNYNLTYKIGIITINKAEVQADGGASSGSANAIFEGSFSADTIISVTIKQSTEYSDMNEAFESLKVFDEEYVGKALSDIFVFSYDNYIPSLSGNETTVKLYLPKLFADANETGETQTEYRVAVLAADGSVSVVSGTREGDYLVIKTEEQVIKAVSVLTEEKEDKNEYDWLLYVGIAVAVLLIAASIVIVVKRA